MPRGALLRGEQRRIDNYIVVFDPPTGDELADDGGREDFIAPGARK